MRKIVLILALLWPSALYSADYHRSDFGGWKQGVRESVIGNNSVQWVRCAYTLAVVPREAIQIDHIVPLRVAWELGAYSWHSSVVREFYNDLDNLVPVLAGVNAAKGDNRPDKWLPLVNKWRYLESWRLICGRYGLNCDYEMISKLEHKIR